MITHNTSLRPSDVAQRLLHLEGKPYSLTNYPMFVDIFNSPASRRLMMSGRQVSKTVTLAADMASEAAITPYLPIMYANASANQTSSFSKSKLDHFLLHSPAIYHTLMSGKDVINNTLHKRFKNMSEIQMSYFSDSADRVRGRSAHRFCLDEVQDILYDAVIDAEECLSAAPDPRFMYAGTSKTVISTLAFFWSLSTKKEWILKCPSCGKWNIPGRENIQRQGLSCKNCGGFLDTHAGRWHSFAEAGKEPLYDGYHIPQIILPLHCGNPEKWAKVIEKMETYPDYKFNNEVLGIASGEGESPVTEELLHSVCVPSIIMEESKTTRNSTGATYLAAGIDWGGGGMAGTSRTTLAIYAVYPERKEFIKIFGKIYEAGEPTKHVESIAFYLNRFQVHMAFGDAGGGNFAMSQLRSLVPGTRVVAVQYAETRAPFSWNESSGSYTVNRTTMIDGLLTDMKLGRVKTMRWEDFSQFADDFRALKVEIIGEEQGKGRRVWRRYPTKPDDCVHSMVFGWFACRILSGLLDFQGN